MASRGGVLDDQSHLSAEYMQQKAVGLLARCGELTAKLQIMMRLRLNLINMPDLVTLSSRLVDEDAVKISVEQLRSVLHSRLSEKIEPARVAPEIERLAPASAMGTLELLMNESRLMHEGHLDIIREREKRQLEAALKEAGWMDDGAGGWMSAAGGDVSKSGDGSSSTTGGGPSSIVDALLDGGGDELAAFQMALKHLEALAPVDWHLDKTMDFLRNKQSEMEMRYAALQDELAALQKQYARMEERKAWMMQELGLEPSSGKEARGDKGGEGAAGKDDEDEDGKPLSASQIIRKRLDGLKSMVGSEAARYLDLSRHTVRGIDGAHAEAKQLQRQYATNDAKLKRICLQKGIDLEAAMEEELVSNLATLTSGDDGDEQLYDEEDEEDGSGSRSRRPKSSAVFRLGSGTDALNVRFSRDGSRLLAVGRPQSAMGLLGGSARSRGDQARQEWNKDRLVDEPSLAGPDEVLAWCAQQIKVLRKRMDARFASLHAKLDTYTVQAARDRQEWQNSVASPISQHVAQLSSLLSRNDKQIADFRADVLQQLAQLAQADRDWEGKHEYYAQQHREALVLFQRLGEEIEEIVG